MPGSDVVEPHKQFDCAGWVEGETPLVSVKPVEQGEPASGPLGLQAPLNLIPLPVEPLFEMVVAALMIPMKYSCLKTFLNANKQHFLARYRKDNAHRRHRLISSSEIVYIRSRIISGPGKAHTRPLL